MFRTLLISLFLTTMVSAAPVPSESKVETPVSKARKAMEQRITAKADGKTLNEAIDLLKEVTKLEITLDTNAILQLGMDPSQTVVKFDFKETKLKDALRTAFASLNLRCGITSTGLVVSTDDGVISRQMRQVVAIDVDGKSLAETLKVLVDETGANLVIDPRAKKIAEEKLTFKIDDVPLESAVRLLADVGGLAVVRMSNVLFVTTEARAEKLRPDADRPVGPIPANPLFGGDVPAGMGGAGGGIIPPPAGR